MLKIAARCRLNILISGGTGSGKTTLLNAMSRMIDNAERTVTIEDAAELQLQQPHVVRLETRPPNLEGNGEITMRDLLKNALRMRPDRIILGEIRGAEALDMLQAMNTGHDGSMSTIHANRPREALTRLENMVGMAGINLPSHAVRTQIAAAVNMILQISRMRDGVAPRHRCDRNRRHGGRHHHHPGAVHLSISRRKRGWTAAWRFQVERFASAFPAARRILRARPAPAGNHLTAP